MSNSEDKAWQSDLDEDGRFNEELVSLLKSRAGKQSVITKKQKAILALLDQEDCDEEDLKELRDGLYNAFLNFEECHYRVLNLYKK